MRALLPTVHTARATTLALFSLGVLWSGTVTLLKVAAALPLPACDPSLERRWRRFLANDRVSVAALWTPLLPVLLAGLGPRELVFVFDPTPDRDDATLLVLGVVYRRRVLPVAWRVVPQQTAWEARLRPLPDERLAEAAAALPAGCRPPLLADRGLVGPAIIAAARAVGWHVVLRLKASAGEAAQVRWPDGREQRLAELPTRPGQRTRAAAIFKGAGWREGFLTIHWAHDQDEPWVLFSERPAGYARVREYRQRVRAEAAYADAKGRGFDLERCTVVILERIDRLLLVLHLALWWASGLGLQAIRNGTRHRFDRRGRRDLSVVRLGTTACLAALNQEHPHALPFRQTPTGWVFPWPA